MSTQAQAKHTHTHTFEVDYQSLINRGVLWFSEQSDIIQVVVAEIKSVQQCGSNGEGHYGSASLHCRNIHRFLLHTI